MSSDQDPQLFMKAFRGAARLLLTLLMGVVLVPTTGLAQDQAQDLLQQVTGQTLTQDQILERLQQSGLSRSQVRQELQRRGYDPSLADPYFDQIEGQRAGALPNPGMGFIEVVRQLAPSPEDRDFPGVSGATVPPADRPTPTFTGRIDVRHILLSYPRPATPTQRDSVLQRAHDLQFRILGGADFGQVAREVSDDPYSAERGGDLGWIEAGQMPPAFDSVAVTLEPGRVSRPVETPAGIHLIWVEDRENRDVFGRRVFSRPTSQFQPTTTGPVDAGYRLGPGDQLVLVLTGGVELAYTLDVTREGFVVIPDVGQLFVNGLTMEELRDRLYDRLGDVYSGISRGPDATTRFDVSLGSLRTNLVYVIGDVERPGGYQISSVATVFNALHRAGGPTEEGSFRNVVVRRDGEVAGRIDLYDYLVNGDANDDIRLQQGDIVFVPPAGPQATLRGRVPRRATYELLEGEGLSDLLTFAGGLEADAFENRIQIDRILPPDERTPDRERVLLDVDLAAIRAASAEVPLRDGDRVAVFGISEERRNRVSVRGDVYNPGQYEYLEDETVRDLLERAGGLRPSSYGRMAHVLRPDLVEGGADLLRVSLAEDAPPGVPQDLTLQDRDEVVVFSVDSLNAADSVSVSGLVQEGRSYAFAQGMTAEDLILAAGGFRRGANPYRAEVARTRIDLIRSDTLTIRIPVALSGEIPYPGNSIPTPDEGELEPATAVEEVPLEPGDWVIVRPLEGYEATRTVQLLGEIRNPGPYVLEEREETAAQLVVRAGGPTREAYLEGFRLVRDSLPVGIDLPAALADPGGDEDLPLEAGDSLIVPAFDPTVGVEGAVAFDARVRYRDGWELDDYLAQAGGVLEEADRSRISVEYANGERGIVNQRPLFFDSKPDVRPGSTIYVPERPPAERGFDWNSFVSRTVSVLGTAATLAIAIARF